jgi:topoisomerase-4 subunit A
MRDKKKAIKAAKSKAPGKEPEKKKKGKGHGRLTADQVMQILPDTVVDETMMSYSARASFNYGSFVVEDRAVPDFRDGLKPVQRRVIYAMYNLGLGHKAKFKKSARVVGDTLGLYHPHGDAACYGSLVGLANTIPKIVDGQGNWGSPVDNAAAQRYTECRLSSFSDLFLLDPGYMKVVPHEQNYDNTTTIPMYLPSTVPTMMLMGNVGGIAYGVRACNPAFEFEGVIKLSEIALSGKKVTHKDCIKHLNIRAPYGSKCVSSPDEIAEFIRTGRASLKFVPHIELNEKQKIIEIKSYSPGFCSAKQVEKAAQKIASHKSVARWTPDCGKKNPKAGPHGAYYYITPKRGISEDDLYDLLDDVTKILTGSEYYCLGVTVRKLDDKNVFSYCSYSTFFNQWAAYRLKLERSYLLSLISQTEIELDRQELLLYAVVNRKQILAVLAKALESSDPDAYMAKALKIDKAKAKAILDLQVRRLAKLEQGELQAKITELKARIKQYKLDHKDPINRTVSHMKKTVNQYLKKQ